METCFLKHSFKKTYQCFSENNIYIYIYISEIQSSFAEAFKLNTDLRSNGSVSISNYTKLIFKPSSCRELINDSKQVVTMSRNLARQISRDLHLDCFAMVLTAGFYCDSRAHNVRKVRVFKSGREGLGRWGTTSHTFS